MAIMEERARTINAALVIESTLGGGKDAELSLPLPVIGPAAH